MAATRLIALHQNKGRTVAQSLGERTDYAKNPEKTEKGETVTAFGCDPYTVDEEFMLQKRQYYQTTGKKQHSDVIAYQIRQSFKPGEITAEEANKVGYELALRFTKGRYSFIVATHTDRAHIHNHIVFNSTSMDSTRKFKDFWRSGLALQAPGLRFFPIGAPGGKPEPGGIHEAVFSGRAGPPRAGGFPPHAVHPQGSGALRAVPFGGIDRQQPAGSPVRGIPVHRPGG